MAKIERCDCKGCKCFGQEYVDRGCGYPVCPSTKTMLSPKKMDVRYKGTFSGDTVVGFTDEVRRMDDMQSKIQEIERLVAEVVDGLAAPCHASLPCGNCPLRPGGYDGMGIRSPMCNRVQLR